MPRRPLQRHALFVGVLLALPMLSLWLGWRAFDPSFHLLRDDNHVYFLPLIHAGQERLWSGDLPFWKHSTLLGSPLFADGQPGVLYAPYCLAWLVSTPLLGRPELLLDVVAMLHAAIGALGMGLLARRLVRHPGAALVAGIAYGLNGFWLCSTQAWIALPVAQSWLPLLCWAAWRSADAPDEEVASRRMGLAAILWAAHAYAGYPQTALLNGMTMAGAGLVAATRSPLGFWRAAWRPVAAVVGGGLLAAPLWLPMKDLADQSIRASGMISLDDATGLSLPPSRLFGMLVPFWPADAKAGYWHAFAHFGTVAAALGLLGLAVGARRRAGWWRLGAGLVVVSLPLTLGENMPGARWLFALPVVKLFRWPFKNIHLWHAGWTLLAAGGAAWLLARPRRKAALWLAAACALAGGLAFLPAKLQSKAEPLQFAWPIAALAFAAAWLLGAKETPLARRRFRRAAPWLWTLATAASLALCARAVRGYCAWDAPKAEVGPVVSSLKGPGRTWIAAPQSIGRAFPPEACNGYALPDNAEAPSANGYTPILSLRYARFMGANMFAFTRPDARDLTLALVRGGGFLDLIGVSTVFADVRDAPMASALTAAGFAPREVNGVVEAWGREAAPQRAFLVQRVVAMEDDEAILAAVHGAGPRLRDTAWISAKLEPGQKIAGGPGRVTRFEELPDAIRVDVETPGPSYLVVSASWDAGWRARVNGRPAFTDRADFALLGVEIPAAGNHVVELEYEPPSFGLGVLLACLAAAGLAGEWAWRRRRNRGGASREAVSETAERIVVEPSKLS